MPEMLFYQGFARQTKKRKNKPFIFFSQNTKNLKKFFFKVQEMLIYQGFQ